MNQIEGKVVPLRQITSDVRIREDYGSLTSLRESLKRQEGQIQSLACMETDVDEYLLLAGGRRLLAMQEEFGDDHPVLIRVYKKEDLTDDLMLAIEMAENLHRKDLSWQEKVNGRERLHNFHVERFGQHSPKKNPDGWTQQRTAELLCIDRSGVAQDLEMAAAMRFMPELAKCKTQDDARKTLAKAQEALVLQEVAVRIEKKTIDTPDDTTRQKIRDSYINGDFFDLIKKVPSGTIHFVDCDPPYGIEFDGFEARTGMARLEGKQFKEVAAKDFPDFIRAVLKELWRVMADGSWILLWFAQDPWFDENRRALVETGFDFKPIPLVWHKGLETMRCFAPSIYLGRSYECAFYARKGDARIVKLGQVDHYDVRVGRPKSHPTEKPCSMMYNILKTFTSPGNRVLVPFAGSGNTLLAAADHGLPAFGYEITPDYKVRFAMKVEAKLPPKYHEL